MSTTWEDTETLGGSITKYSSKSQGTYIGNLVGLTSDKKKGPDESFLQKFSSRTSILISLPKDFVGFCKLVHINLDYKLSVFVRGLVD